ncbi:hypothetical protein GJV08_02155 [Enterobacteriaceae bacterium RIT692]|nr:hypothetical protein [Enterobacteriaceae bacterium RIT692]
MLNIPIQIQEKLNLDPGLHSEVIGSLNEFLPWIADNKLIFFPDYTDHGTNHIQEVLNTVCSIITDESWEVLTSHDASAICISILLHDCAMHLTEDGFYNLINDKYPTINSRFYTEKLTWKQKWLTFFATSKRWDGKKLKSIFGDNIPVKEIPDNKNDLTRRDRLLIGEFLRIEHASLAHSIALDGVPGPSETRLKTSIKDNKLSDLFGFIARSHNMPLRLATDGLDRTQRRRLLNTHTPFIMGVLRIADYIQVQNSRAKSQLLLIKRLSSPISKGEWNKHHCIMDINQTHDDPEALYIDAEPDSPTTFKDLKKLFNDIQHELDTTWSILGEIYGRYDKLNSLGVNIRRIRSSLDDVALYIKTKQPEFIPQPLRFTTSDADMMKLLISPLYGDNPTIGIRELLQNSVDACNERIDYHQKSGQFEIDISEIDVKIKLEKKESEYFITITDRGIGMTLDVIENYFLNIGASFRNSDRWKKMHETEGKSNVYRTGRFGVGLLAAFLLGDTIKVTTRHVSEKKGYEFFCTQQGDDISLLPKSGEVGTSIEIKICQKTFDMLEENYSFFNENWDWYCLETPKVNRLLKINDEEEILKQSLIVPGIGSDISNSIWNRIEHPDFDDILWTVLQDNENWYFQTQLVCNGIKVDLDHTPIEISIAQSGIDINNKKPRLVVFDQNGILPLNLQRNGFTSQRLPFHEECLRDISLKLSKSILDYCNSLHRELNEELVKKMLSPEILELELERYRREDISVLLYSNQKLFPCHERIINKLQPTSILLDIVSENDSIGSWSCSEMISTIDIYMPYNIQRRSKSSKVSFLRKTLEGNDIFENLPVCGKLLIIKKSEIPQIVSQGNFPKTKWAQLKKELEFDEWIAVSIGDVPPCEEHFSTTIKKLDRAGQSMVLVTYIDWEKDIGQEIKNNDGNIFLESWLEVSGTLMI